MVFYPLLRYWSSCGNSLVNTHTPHLSSTKQTLSVGYLGERNCFVEYVLMYVAVCARLRDWSIWQIFMTHIDPRMKHFLPPDWLTLNVTCDLRAVRSLLPEPKLVLRCVPFLFSSPPLFSYQAKQHLLDPACRSVVDVEHKHTTAHLPTSLTSSTLHTLDSEGQALGEWCKWGG